VRAGDPKWCEGFPSPLRLSDRSEGDVGEGNRSQRTSSSVPPAPLHLLYTRSATGAHNHQLVGAPDQGVRSNGPETSHAVGHPLRSIQQIKLPCVYESSADFLSLVVLLAPCTCTAHFALRLFKHFVHRQTHGYVHRIRLKVWKTYTFPFERTPS
jgi:hypothetical protein